MLHQLDMLFFFSLFVFKQKKEKPFWEIPADFGSSLSLPEQNSLMATPGGPGGKEPLVPSPSTGCNKGLGSAG